MINKKKAVVTGVAGALGSHMAERLVKEGYVVVGIDSHTPYYSIDIKKANQKEVQAVGITCESLDLTKDSLDEVLDGASIIMHFAGQPGISAATPFEDYLNNNFIATERLLEAAEKISSLETFINIATSSVYGSRASGDEASEPKPTSFYGVTKLAAEQLALARAREKNFPALSLRIFSVYGERERPDKFFHKLITSIMKDEEVPLHEGSRDHVRSFSYVGDIIDGCMKALAHAPENVGEIFNLGSNVPHTTGEAIDIIENILGKKARFKAMPPRPGDQKETAANIAKAQRVLGWTPQVSLEKGLAREIEWLQRVVR